MKRNIFSKKLSFVILTGMFILVSMSSGIGAKTTATTNQILPTADTYVDEFNPNTNYGTQTTMSVRHSETGFSVGMDQEAYFTYDLSSFSCDTKVQLALYTISSATLTLAIHEVTNTSWTETGITWNTKPAYANATVVSEPAQDNKYTYFDVTSMAQSHQGGKMSLAVVSTTDSTNFVMIYSKDNVINNKPYDGPYLSCVGTVGQTPTTSAPGLTGGLLLVSVVAIVTFRKMRK